MPYCKVEGIRLIANDPRAKNCDARDLQGIDNLLTEGSPLVCEYCTGFANCDHTVVKGFTVFIECFDDTITAKELQFELEHLYWEKYGMIKVQEGIDETWRLM